MLLTQLLDDLSPRRRLVPKDSAPGAVHERVDHVVRKPMRIGRQRLRSDDPHQLPVPRRGVLAFGAFGQPAGDGGRARLRRAPFERLDVAEAESLEIRKVEAADSLRNISKRVRALVPIVARVGQLSCADGVEDDHAGARHAAILGRPWRPSSD